MAEQKTKRRYCNVSIKGEAKDYLETEMARRDRNAAYILEELLLKDKKRIKKSTKE